MWNMKNIVKKSSSKESPTVFWMPPLSSGISENSCQKVTPEHIRGWLMLLQEVFPVSPSLSPAKDSPKTTREICGPKQSQSFAQYDRGIHSWKMFQDFFPTIISEQFLGTWPKAGIIADGMLSELPTLVRTIEENGCGFWPTPQTMDSIEMTRPVFLKGKSYRIKSNQGIEGQAGLRDAVKMFPTPTKQDACNNAGPSQANRNTPPLNSVVGGSLNPAWVDWLMGWPIEWTDLKPLEMDKFRSVWLIPFQNYLKELLSK